MKKGTHKKIIEYCVLFVGIVMCITVILFCYFQDSIMRHGKWETSTIVFFITAFIGIIGIGFNGKMIEICRKHFKNECFASTRCECLDFVEASHRHKVYPVMYCHMKIAGHLDIDRLKAAIQSTRYYVPEILYVYDFKHGRFKDIGLSVDDMVILEKDLYLWDLSRRPQLQISICKKEIQDNVVFGISHILTDAKGFLQYLYLLVTFYNGHLIDLPFQNNRKIIPVLKDIYIHKPTQQTQRGKRKKVPPLRACNKDKEFFCLVSQISCNEFSSLHAKAQKYKVTLNTVFMTAYARVIARLKQIEIVTIPCPADLRRFSNTTNELTVANMTGIYRRVTVEIKPQHTCSN